MVVLNISLTASTSTNSNFHFCEESYSTVAHHFCQKLPENLVLCNAWHCVWLRGLLTLKIICITPGACGALPFCCQALLPFRTRVVFVTYLGRMSHFDMFFFLANFVCSELCECLSKYKPAFISVIYSCSVNFEYSVFKN